MAVKGLSYRHKSLPSNHTKHHIPFFFPKTWYHDNNQMHTSSKQHHRTETQPVLLNILRNRNSDVDVNDTLFTVTCHISLCTAWNWHIWIQLKGMSFTQARPQAGLNMQRSRKLDRVRFVLCGTRLLWASPPAVKYTTANKQSDFTHHCMLQKLQESTQPTPMA